jgi:hypothetical protein
MEKLEHIKKLIQEIEHSEGEGFVLNQMNLSQEINKYETENASLVIKIITILGGILGSSFLVSFISMIFQFNKDQYFILGFGLVLIVAAVLSSRFSKLLIFDTIFVATLLWGIMLISVSSISLKVDERWISFYFLAIGIFTIAFTKNSYQILIAVLMIAGSLLWMIQIYKYFWLFHGYIVIVVFSLVQIILNEAKIICSRNFLMNFYSPFKIGLIIVLLFSLGLVSIKSEIPFNVYYPWISSIPAIAAILIFIQVLFTKLGVREKNTRILVNMICLIVLGLTAISPAIAGSILVILLCFYINYKTGFVFGVLSLLYFVCMFYYELGYSLLIKSEMLFVSGIIFGGIYFLSSKKLMTHEKN